MSGKHDQLARDVTDGRDKYVVSARRFGIVSSANGIEAIASLVKLLLRVARRDRRYEVLVWNDGSFPFMRPRYTEIVEGREEARERVASIAAEITAGAVPG